MEQNSLESCRGIEVTSVKPKSKGVFNAVGLETDSFTLTSKADTSKVWSNPSLNCPCPLDSHTHELAECKELLTM